MESTALQRAASGLLGLALLAPAGCAPPATQETVTEGQKESPAPGTFQDAVPASITTLDAGNVDLAGGARAANALVVVVGGRTVSLSNKTSYPRGRRMART